MVVLNWPLVCSLTPKGLSPALSPALQRLVNRTSSKYTDKALRASYTPSPSHRASGSKTPLGAATPTGTPTPNKSKTPSSQDLTSLTDNLLQLPKRRKASDYFWVGEVFLCRDWKTRKWHWLWWKTQKPSEPACQCQGPHVFLWIHLWNSVLSFCTNKHIVNYANIKSLSTLFNFSFCVQLHRMPWYSISVRYL